MTKSVIEESPSVELPMWRVADEKALRGADRIRLAFVFLFIAAGIVGAVHLFPSGRVDHLVDTVNPHRHS